MLRLKTNTSPGLLLNKDLCTVKKEKGGNTKRRQHVVGTRRVFYSNSLAGEYGQIQLQKV